MSTQAGTLRSIVFTTAFKKDWKRCGKDPNRDQAEIQNVVRDLATRKPLPASRRDHPLKGEFAGHRECHVRGDWLLIYKIDGDNLVLLRTGTHTELFD